MSKLIALGFTWKGPIGVAQTSDDNEDWPSPYAAATLKQYSTPLSNPSITYSVSSYTVVAI